MTVRRFPAVPAFAALLLDAAAAPAQSITESYAPVAPSITIGQYKASHGWLVNSGRAAGNGVVWSDTDLGVPAGGNVDALADGLDIFPPNGPANPPIPTSCRTYLIEHTVTPATLGCAGGAIRAQSPAGGGNGAHSDTFLVRWSPPAPPAAPALGSDHAGISPSTDIDALAWRDRRKFPVWFSVDAATAATMTPPAGQPPFRAADILWVPSPGLAPRVYLPAALLGLDPGDDIDGLAMANAPPLPQPPIGTIPNVAAGAIVYSLRAGSPNAWAVPADITTNHPIGPGGLFRFTMPGVLGGWANDFHLGLGTGPGINPSCGGGAVDDLNGVRITDPMLDSGFGSGGGPGSPGGLLLDNVTGGHRMIVDFNVGELVPFSMVDVWGGAASALHLFVRAGIPCDSRALTIPPYGTIVFFQDIVPGSQLSLPLPAPPLLFSLPVPLQITAQGIATGPAGFVSLTNAIVLNVEP